MRRLFGVRGVNVTDLSIVAIIPLYNGARWIEKTVNSVLSQTLQPDEFIVVDDGSIDGGAGAATVEIMAKKHPIITLLRKPNGGQSSARNFAVAHSKSALLAFLDQDDVWYPTHLEELVKPFKDPDNAELGWVYSNLNLIDEGGGMLVRGHLLNTPGEHPKRLWHRCVSEDMHVLPSASLINRSAFAAIGGFDEQLSGYEDDDLFLRLFEAGFANAYLDQSLSDWRIVASSSGRSPHMITSGSIYLQKLIKKYPAAYELIAPRFLRWTIAGYASALRIGDEKYRRVALENMVRIVSPLRWQVRLPFGLLLPLLTSPMTARICLPMLELMARRLGLRSQSGFLQAACQTRSSGPV
jgi:glycosyltransferase involved in cell wall biosynthesis